MANKFMKKYVRSLDSAQKIMRSFCDAFGFSPWTNKGNLVKQVGDSTRIARVIGPYTVEYCRIHPRTRKPLFRVVIDSSCWVGVPEAQCEIEGKPDATDAMLLARALAALAGRMTV